MITAQCLVSDAGVLRGRIDSLQLGVKSSRIKASQQEIAIERFRSDVQMAIKHILAPDLLRESVEKMVEAHGATGALKPRYLTNNSLEL